MASVDGGRDVNMASDHLKFETFLDLSNAATARGAMPLPAAAFTA
jgi:hypothetical protein